MDIKSLKEEFAKLSSEVSDSVNEAAKAGKFSAEAKTANEQKYARMDEIKAVLDADKTRAKYAVESGNTEEFSLTKQVVKSGDDANKRDAKEAFNRFLLTGQRDEFTLTSASGGGVLVPNEILAPIVKARRQNVLMQAILDAGLQVIRTTGVGNVTLPIFDDSANSAGVQAEDATTQQIAEPSLTGMSIAPALYTSKGVWISNTALLANQFDLGAYVVPMLQRRLEQYTADRWFTYIKANGTVGVTAASTSGLSYNELIDIEHAVPVENRTQNQAIFGHDSLLKALRKLQDSTGQSILEHDPEKHLDYIHGIPFYVDNTFDAVGAGATVGAIGSLDGFYPVISGQPRVVVYKDIPTRPDQTGYQIFENGGFGALPDYFRLIKMAA